MILWISPIEAAEVESAPAGVDNPMDQGVDAPVPRCRVITPDHMNRHGSTMAWMAQDHTIFTENILRIRAALGDTGLPPLQQQVLERLVHSSGDLALGVVLLEVSEGTCEQGLEALKQGPSILMDTAMAAAAVASMADRTLKTPVHTVLEWAPDKVLAGSTCTAAGLAQPQ